jgi:hypothetical protein
MARKKVGVPAERDGSASYLKWDSANDTQGGAMWRIIGHFAVTRPYAGTGHANQSNPFTPAIRWGSRCQSEGSAGTLTGGGASR